MDLRYLEVSRQHGVFRQNLFFANAALRDIIVGDLLVIESSVQ